MCDLYQFLGLVNILFDWIVGTVKHNGGKSCFDTLIAALISTMIQMQCNRNGDIQFIDHSGYHSCYGLETGHVFSCALRYTQDNRGI